jgi:xanthine dehydrogenase YagT iron-sulfur-binding subunit
MQASEMAGREIDITINGRAQRVIVDPRTSLLDLLRERLDLTGTKKGCNQGACGACTILVDGRRIVSCLALAIMHQGATITTIEGLADGESLHPLQSAFIDQEGAFSRALLSTLANDPWVRLPTS